VEFRDRLKELLQKGESFAYIGDLRTLHEVAEEVGVRIYEGAPDQGTLGTGFCLVEDEREMKERGFILLTDTPSKKYPTVGFGVEEDVWAHIRMFVFGQIDTQQLVERTHIPARRLEPMVVSEALERLKGKNLLLFLDRISKGGLMGVWLERTR